MNLKIKLPQIAKLEAEIEQLKDKIAASEKEINELKASLETSRRLYSAERQARDRAQDAAELLTDHNAFLRDALMRAYDLQKEQKEGADSGG